MFLPVGLLEHRTAVLGKSERAGRAGGAPHQPPKAVPAQSSRRLSPLLRAAVLHYSKDTHSRAVRTGLSEQGCSQLSLQTAMLWPLGLLHPTDLPVGPHSSVL